MRSFLRRLLTGSQFYSLILIRAKLLTAPRKLDSLSREPDFREVER